jgi:hypothetical protein
MPFLPYGPYRLKRHGHSVREYVFGSLFAFVNKGIFSFSGRKNYALPLGVDFLTGAQQFN